MRNNRLFEIKKYSRFLFVAVLFHFSCTKNYDQYNTDPNKITSQQLTSDNLTIKPIITSLERSIFMTQKSQAINNYQVDFSLTGDIFSGHQGTCDAYGNNSVNNSTYAMYAPWYNLAFGDAFQFYMAPWYQIKTEAAKLGSTSSYALAQILKVAGMHRITDMYGPLPYLNFSPSASLPYNGQKDIYNSFFMELDSAIATLTDFVVRYPGANTLGTADVIYNGNFNNWIKFANTLKLRLAMRVAYTNATFETNGYTAQQLAEQAVASGVLTTNGDNAMIYPDNSATLNPLYITVVNYDDMRMGATMESYMKGYNDPRMPLWFSKVSLPAGTAPDYHGIRPGSVFTGRSYNVFSPINVTQTTPVCYMSAAEAYFLRAEGAIRGWNMGGTAQSLYETGITTSFGQSMGSGQLSAGGAANYIANATGVPVNYVDPVTASNNIAAQSSITVKWNESDVFEKKLERIITQKWLAIFPDGQEAWAEFRRTGYPKIFPVAKNNSGGLVNTTVQIRRVPFPTTEYLTNSANVNLGVTELKAESAGAASIIADNAGTKLWWDKKP